MDSSKDQPTILKAGSLDSEIVLPTATPPSSSPQSTTRVNVVVDVPIGEIIHITIAAVPNGAQPVSVRIESLGASIPPSPSAIVQPLPLAWPGKLARRFFFALAAIPLPRLLMLLALALYLATRLAGLTRWPIYFFTDEAVQTNFAQELVQGGGTWRDGTFLPTFFENAGQYEMNVSVYVQVIPYLLFGKSELVTRGVSVLITLLGAFAIGLILNKPFRLPYAWVGVLFLSITPAWFLHSRTAFETSEAVSLYAIFLLFYLLYRTENVWYLFPCLFFGALTLYTYSPAQVVILASGILLLLSDARFHIKNWRFALGGFVFLAMLSVPYDLFLVQHPTGNQQQLAILNSYWLRDTSLWNKLTIYAGDYIKGLNPVYWFAPEQESLVRHMMLNYGHVLWATFPLALLGFLLVVWNFRDSRFRVILVALLAAPAGAAMVGITITRALFMVVPLAILDTLGCVLLLSLFEQNPTDLPAYLSLWRERILRLPSVLPAHWKSGSISNHIPATVSKAKQPAFHAWRLPRTAIALGLFLLLGSINLYMTWDALVYGPTWYKNYGLYGMQYGGEQLTSAMRDYTKQNPDTRFIVSPDWANGTDAIMNFFLPDDYPYRMDGIDRYLQQISNTEPNDVVILTPDEYARAQKSGLFAEIQTIQILLWPDGRPGFYFLRLRYAEDADERIAAQKAELAKPVDELLTLNEELVRVVHSRLDMGSLPDGFDNNPVSLIRGLSANPLFLELNFPAPRTFTAVRALVGAAPTRLTMILYPPDGSAPRSFQAEVPRATENHEIVLMLPETITADHIRLEFLVVGEAEPTHVHIFGIILEGDGWKSVTDAPGS
jgi:hypothetical protein